MCQSYRSLLQLGHILQTEIHALQYIPGQLLCTLLELRQLNEDVGQPVSQKSIMCFFQQSIYRLYVSDRIILI